MRLYIPPYQLEAMTDEQQDMWAGGAIARLLMATGISIVNQTTIPHICYRINMLSQADVMVKSATNMPIDEIVIPDVVTPGLLMPFMEAVIEGEPFKVLTDKEFVEKLMSKVEPLDILPMFTATTKMFNLADRELGAQ